MQPRHAVFVTTTDNDRARVTRWLDWGRAQDEWSRLDDRRRAGELPGVKFFEVRAGDDPSYKGLPLQTWAALPVEERPQYVQLSRPDRARLLDIGRAAGDMQSAADAMFDVLAQDAEWSHLEA